MQKILIQHNINEPIRGRYIINLDPISIYIITENSQYILLSKNYFYCMYENDFELYTPEQYKERFSVYEGTLNIQGLEKDSGAPLFHNNDIYVPIRSVLNIIGAQNIQWNKETQAIYFELDGQSEKMEAVLPWYMVMSLTNTADSKNSEHKYGFYVVNKNGYFYTPFSDVREILIDYKLEIQPSFEKREVIVKPME